MKKLTKVLMLVLAVALVLAAFAVTAFAATTDDEAVSEGLHWKYTNSSDAEQYTADLSVAVTNAKAGSTVYLLDSYTITTDAVIATITKGLTVDLGGNTLNISQSGVNAEIQIKTTEKVTFKNGTIHACGNEGLKAGATYGYANAIFRVKATSIDLHVEQVNTYMSNLVYNDRWSGFNKTGITIEGGTHYLYYLLNPDYTFNKGGILNAAMSFTVEANGATFVMDYKGSLMNCASYKEKTEESRHSTATFNNCTIMQQSSGSSIITYANNYHYYYFNNCDIYGGFAPDMSSFDKDNVPAGTAACTYATSANIVFGEGTRWTANANNAVNAALAVEPSTAAGVTKHSGLSVSVSHVLDACPTNGNVSPLTGNFAVGKKTYTYTYNTVVGGNEMAYSFISGGNELTAPSVPGKFELREVLLAADAGTTVTLLTDVTYAAREAGEKEIMRINKTLTVNLGGHTLTLKQNGKSYFNILSNTSATFENGTIVAYRTDAALGHPIFRMNAGANITLNNVNTYSASIAFSYKFAGYSTLTINGGEHHKILKSDVWDSFIEVRAGLNFSATNATFNVQSGYFICDSMYNGDSDAPHSYTFTNCNIIGKTAATQLLYYTSALTAISFNNCDIAGSLQSTTYNTDLNTVGALKSGAIYIGAGTRFAQNATIQDGIYSLPDGYELTVVEETKTLNLNTASGTVGGQDFVIAPAQKTLTFASAVKIPEAPTYSVTVGGVAKEFGNVDFTEVVEAVDDGGVITLLQDANYVQNDIQKITKQITVNLNGYTLNVDQTKSGGTGELAYLSLQTAKTLTIEGGNGGTIIHTNSSAANNGKVFAFLHVGAANANIVVNDVNYTGGAFIYNQLSKNVTVTINGGNYHMNVGASNLSGGIYESRNNTVFTMSNADIYLEKNVLLTSLSYQALSQSITPESTFTFTDCDIYRPNASDNMILYSNAHTTVTFIGCNTHGSIAAGLHNFDKDKVAAPTAANVVLGEGTTIANGATANAVLQEGLGKLEDSGNYTFALSGATYTKSGIIADVSESKFIFTSAKSPTYALPSRTLADVIELVDSNGEIVFLDDIFIYTPDSTTNGQYATINKGLTINLNGYTLYFSQSNKQNAFFKVNTDSPVSMIGGTAVWNINADYVENNKLDLEKTNEQYCTFALFNVTKDNAVLNFNDLKAYGSNIVYSYDKTGITVNIKGGEYHVTNSNALFGHGIVDLRANATINFEDALIDLTKTTSATLFTLTSYKEKSADKASSAYLKNCYIIAKYADTNVLPIMNNYTTVTFDECYIYGSIKPTRSSNDNNAVKDSAGNITTPNTVTDPLDNSIILTKGTYLTSKGYEASFQNLLKTEGEYVIKETNLSYTTDIAEMISTLYDVTADTLVTDIVFTTEAKILTLVFDLEVGDAPPAKFAVNFYKEDGQTVILTVYVYGGETVTPPTYTPGAGNGWYKVGFDGWTTSFGSSNKITDFTISGDTNFYPAQTASNSAPIPYLTGAQYNLTFTGSLILNFYLPTAPENVSNIRVTFENGTPISYENVFVNQGNQKTYFKLYEIANLSPTQLTESLKILVKFDVDGVELTQTVTLSAVKYAKKILTDSQSANPTWTPATHSMIADLVRYSNELSNAAGIGYVAELDTLLDTYGKLCTPTNANNSFSEITTSMQALNGYVTSVQFAISELRPQWIINLNTAKKIVDVAISLEGYYPLPDENGVNFGMLVYGVDEANSTRSGAYLESAYIESMPVYNMDRDLTITVTLEDGTEISGSYNLAAYYTGMSATGETLYNWQKFLQTFRAFASSASNYRYADGIVKEEAPTKDFFDCDHASAKTKAFNDTNGQYCDTCETYIFFYDSYITNRNYGGKAYTSRDAAMAEKESSYAAIHYCHAKANQRSGAGYKAGCVATPGAVYYLGYPTIYNGTLAEITVQTNTQWDGAYIISDESEIAHNDAGYTHNLFCVRGYGDKTTGTNYVAGGTDVTSYFSSDIKAGATKVSFAPGIPMMLSITDKSVARYIRTGNNSNSGEAQNEVILIDEFGNVSNTTPITWDYTYSTASICSAGCTFKDSNSDGKCDTCGSQNTPRFSVTAYVITDEHIRISGLDSDGNISATFENIANNNISTDAYYACKRGVTVRRSNVTVEGIYHEFTEDSTNTTPRQAYQGFRAWLANNVTFENISVKQHLNHYVNNDTNGTLLGSYEFSADDAINVSWINCKVRNFFNSDGSLDYRGLFGTNGTRNMYLRDCILTSFDAHTAAGNVTIENSTFEHLNFIGIGDIRLNDVTVYMSNGSSAAIILRQDYGAYWRGDLYIDGLELRYDANNYTTKYIDLVKATYANKDHGYGTAAGSNTKPQNIYANDISIMQYSRKANSNSTIELDEYGKIIESVGYKAGTIPLAIYYYLNEDLTVDQDYSTKHSSNNNPLGCTENIYLTNSNVELSYPDHPFFENMNVYIDGVEQDWYTKRNFSSGGNSGGGGCVTGDTLVTMADGSQKRIDELKDGDMVLAYSFEEGKFVAVPAAKVFAHEIANNTVIALTFSDGTVVKVVNAHKFMNAENNEFVDINAENVQSYIGMNFFKVVNGALTTVELTGYEIYEEYCVAWATISAYHYNILVEGMLSLDIRDEFVGAFRYFEIAEDMTFDDEAMAEDIREYGLYTYDDFADYLTEEEFELLNVKYMKVAVGKGYVTFDDLLMMIYLFL